MAGTLLPLMLLGWTGISLWAAHRTGIAWAQRGGLRPLTAWLLQALVLAVLLPLPLLDELVAQSQFEALCRDQTAVQRIAQAGPGRHVHRVALPPAPLAGLTVPVTRYTHLYIDDTSRETLARVDAFEAHPGKLARVTGRTAQPLTFTGWCNPSDPQSWLAGAGWLERMPEAKLQTLGEGAPSP